MRNAIRRVGEDTGARRRGRRAMALEATRIGAREREAVRSEGVAVDLAEVVADLPGARVLVLELQDRLLDLPRYLALLTERPLWGET